MIQLHQILKKIREYKDYSNFSIANILDKTTRRFHDMESRHIPLTRHDLDKWLIALDISSEDREWFHVQLDREKNYLSLPNKLPVRLLLALATLITLKNKVSDDCVDELVAIIQKHTLKYLSNRPRIADIAIDKILLDETK